MRRAAGALLLVLALGAVTAGQGDRVAEALEALGSEDVRDRLYAVDVLGGELPTAPVVSGLLLALRDRSELVRIDASAQLGGVDPTPAVLAALIEALEDGSSAVRAGAAGTLGSLGDPSAAAALARAAQDEHRGAASQALRALLSLGPPLPPAVIPGLERLHEALEPGDALALAASVRPLREGIPVMRRIWVRWRSEESHGRAGENLEWWLRSELGSRLVQAGPAGVRDLCEALVPTPPAAEFELLEALLAHMLGQLGPRAVDALPLLRRWLLSYDDRMWTRAAHMIDVLGPVAEPLLPELVACLEERPSDWGLAHAIVAMGAAAEPALGPLTEWARSQGRDSSCTDALGSLGAKLRAQGRTAWWVPWRFYAEDLLLSAILLVLWWGLFAAARRRGEGGALMACAGVLPGLLAACGFGLLCSRGWVQPFLPQPPMAVVPLPLAAGLSALFLCTLPSVWIYATFAPRQDEEQS